MKFMIYYVLCIIANEIVPNFNLERMITTGIIFFGLSCFFRTMLGIAGGK